MNLNKYRAIDYWYFIAAAFKVEGISDGFIWEICDKWALVINPLRTVIICYTGLKRNGFVWEKKIVTKPQYEKFASVESAKPFRQKAALGHADVNHLLGRRPSLISVIMLNI